MGKVKKPNPVKLVVGLIFKEECVLSKAELILKNKFLVEMVHQVEVSSRFFSKEDLIQKTKELV